MADIEHLIQRGGFGRKHVVDQRDANYPMRAALKPKLIKAAPPRRRWRLLRKDQLDQGSRPTCVAHTGKHWERSLPIRTTVGLDAEQLYARCKAIDGYPDQDGTDGRSMMKVYQELGKVEGYYWWTGDDEALKLWLLTRSPVWLGAYWAQSMLQGPVLATNVLDVGQPDMSLGHETLIVGYDRPRDVAEICNSWGLSWGKNGRALIRWADLARLLRADGDAAGAVEKKAS